MYAPLGGPARPSFRGARRLHQRRVGHDSQRGPARRAAGIPRLRGGRRRQPDRRQYLAAPLGMTAHLRWYCATERAGSSRVPFGHGSGVAAGDVKRTRSVRRGIPTIQGDVPSAGDWLVHHRIGWQATDRPCAPALMQSPCSEGSNGPDRPGTAQRHATPDQALSDSTAARIRRSTSSAAPSTGSVSTGSEMSRSYIFTAPGKSSSLQPG